MIYDDPSFLPTLRLANMNCRLVEGNNGNNMSNGKAIKITLMHKPEQGCQLLTPTYVNS